MTMITGIVVPLPTSILSHTELEAYIYLITKKKKKKKFKSLFQRFSLYIYCENEGKLIILF